MPEFQNAHLSYSRLSRFEQCPLSFRFQYVDGLRAEPGIPLRFGKAIHAVLETLVREHMEAEQSGPLSEERAADLWQEAWISEGLSGVERHTTAANWGSLGAHGTQWIRTQEMGWIPVVR